MATQISIIVLAAIFSFPGANANAGKLFVQTFHYTTPTVEALASQRFHLSTDQNSPCDIIITKDGSTSAKVTVSSGKPIEYQVPKDLSKVYKTYPPTFPPIRGIKLEAQCDFVVHGINFFTASTDGWLGIPTESLGSDYWVMNVVSGNDEPLQLSIVAVQDGTTCNSTFPNGTTRGSNLNALGVDYMESDRDFTGTHVVCNKNVSVFSGQRCGVVPAGCRACNHMVEQIPPATAFGYHHILAPIANRPCITKPTCCKDPKQCIDCLEFYRVLASENATELTRLGLLTNETFALQAGESRLLAIPQQEYSLLISTQPVLVGQYGKGWAYQGTTQAPFFAIVPSIEHYQWRYTFVACSVKATYHINVVIRSDKAVQLLLNGFAFLNGNTGRSIPSTHLSAYEHILKCDNTRSFVVEHPVREPFGLLLYMETTVAGSYGYPAGMSFNADIENVVEMAGIPDALASIGSRNSREKLISYDDTRSNKSSQEHNNGTQIDSSSSGQTNNSSKNQTENIHSTEDSDKRDGVGDKAPKVVTDKNDIGKGVSAKSSSDGNDDNRNDSNMSTASASAKTAGIIINASQDPNDMNTGRGTTDNTANRQNNDSTREISDNTEKRNHNKNTTSPTASESFNTTNIKTATTLASVPSSAPQSATTLKAISSNENDDTGKATKEKDGDRTSKDGPGTPTVPPTKPGLNIADAGKLGDDINGKATIATSVTTAMTPSVLSTDRCVEATTANKKTDTSNASNEKGRDTAHKSTQAFKLPPTPAAIQSALNIGYIGKQIGAIINANKIPTAAEVTPKSLLASATASRAGTIGSSQKEDGGTGASVSAVKVAVAPPTPSGFNIVHIAEVGKRVGPF